MYGKSKNSTVPSDSQAREKYVYIVFVLHFTRRTKKEEKKNIEKKKNPTKINRNFADDTKSKIRIENHIIRRYAVNISPFCPFRIPFFPFFFFFFFSSSLHSTSVYLSTDDFFFYVYFSTTK